jgi:hypothetical protein
MLALLACELVVLGNARCEVVGHAPHPFSSEQRHEMVVGEQSTERRREDGETLRNNARSANECALLAGVMFVGAYEVRPSHLSMGVVRGLLFLALMDELLDGA